MEADLLEYLKTHTVEQTAKQFNISPTTVRRRARRSGITNIEEYQTREDKINIEELKKYFEDHNLQECEKKFGVGANYLSKRLKSAGVDTTKHSLMSGFKLNIDELKKYFKTHTLKECAEKYGCSQITVKRKLQKEGIDTSIYNHSKKAYEKWLETKKDVSFLTKDFLHKEYIVENKDAHLIAEENDVHFNTVLAKIREHGLNVKSRERVAESLSVKYYQKTGYWWPGQTPEVLEKVFKLRSKYKYSSDKSEKTYQFKSLHELCYALYVDNHEEVVSWWYEKIKIPYIDGDDGRNRLYYIDFNVLYHDGHEEWVEIKPNWRMIPEDKELYASHKAESSGTTYTGINDEIRSFGYNLFLSGYNKDKIEFVNPQKLLPHKQYTLWFKDKSDFNVSHDHNCHECEVGNYVKREFRIKRKNRKTKPKA